jgi:hypothetical protein
MSNSIVPRNQAAKKWRYDKYDAQKNCKSAGIIPYTFRNGELLFLFQQLKNPNIKKERGWNDFGGKRIDDLETTFQTAAREFSEETSCLFYLHMIKKDIEAINFIVGNDIENTNIIKEIIIDTLPDAQKFFHEIITREGVLYASSKETYITYFLKVEYIPEDSIPESEDLHLNYEKRYIRACKWLKFEDIMQLRETDFHKRLQITRIQQRIKNYHEKNVFK